MHLATILAALLLPLAAVAEDMTTTTSTSTLTLTQTLTLQRASMVTSIPSNIANPSIFPSTTLSSPVSSTTTEAPLVTNDENSGSTLGAAQFAALAVAGVVAAALL
jgi:hypothetical protein